jgi:hypothetical protein
MRLACIALVLSGVGTLGAQTPYDIGPPAS